MIDGKKWVHQDSNLGPTGYEPVALPLSYGPEMTHVTINDEKSIRQEIEKEEASCEEAAMSRFIHAHRVIRGQDLHPSSPNNILTYRELVDNRTEI
jgi:hypothetical protein